MHPLVPKILFSILLVALLALACLHPLDQAISIRGEEQDGSSWLVPRSLLGSAAAKPKKPGPVANPKVPIKPPSATKPAPVKPSAPVVSSKASVSPTKVASSETLKPSSAASVLSSLPITNSKPASKGTPSPTPNKIPSSASPQPTSTARTRCSLLTCGKNTCSIEKRAAIERRVPRTSFAVLTRPGSVNSLRTEDTNTDLSDITTDDGGLLSSFVAFDGTYKSMTITQLVGCTAVIAFSPHGMFGAHMLEWDSLTSNNDLSQEGSPALIRKAATQLQTQQANLAAGGSLFIYLPKVDGKVPYDDPVPSKAAILAQIQATKADPDDQDDINEAIAQIPQLATSQPISQSIVAGLQTASGLRATKKFYTPGNGGSQQVRGANQGTFVLQYLPGQNDAQVRITAEGNSLGTFTIALPPP